MVKKAGKTKVHSGEKVMVACEGKLYRVVKGWMREVKSDAMSRVVPHMYIVHHRYLCGSTLVWYNSKHGTTHMGMLHCLHR